MKFLYKVIPIGCLSVLFLSSCMIHHAGPFHLSSRPNIPPIETEKLPDKDSKSARLFRSVCKQCHNLPSPMMHTAAEWRVIVPRMVTNMRQPMTGMMIRTPNTAEQIMITDYLTSNAQQPLAADENVDLNSPDGRLFKRVCSRCHDLPSPKQHTKDEWPSVLDRMNTNMKNMGKSLPNADETIALLRFLQNNAIN